MPDITILAGAVRAVIQGFASLPPDVKEKLDEQTRFRPAGSWYMAKAAAAKAVEPEQEDGPPQPSWDGQIRKLTETGTFPCGLVSIIVKTLQNLGYGVQVASSMPEPAREYEPGPPQQNLRPTQQDAVDTFMSLAPPHRGIIQMPPRSGKTRVAAEVARLLAQEKTLFLCERLDIAQPPRGAVTKFGDYLGPDFPLGWAYDGEYQEGRIVIATIQTVSNALGIKKKPKKGEKRERLLTSDQQKALATYVRSATLVIGDECFVAGTLVDGRPIESLQQGECVTAWDSTTQQFRRARILRTMKRPAPGMLVRLSFGGKHLVCTENHPVLTLTGWQTAGSLVEGDYMVQDTMEAHNDDRKAMPGLWSEDRRLLVSTVPGMCGHSTPNHQTRAQLLSLQPGIRSQPRPMGHLQPFRERVLHPELQSHRTIPQVVRNDGEDQQEIRQRTNATKEPDARRPQGTREGTNYLTNHGPQTLGARRKWQRTHDSRDATFLSTRMAYQCGRQSRKGTGVRELPNLLQDRRWQRDPESGNRSGRAIPHITNSEATRSKEASIPGITRVDRVEILQRGRDEEFGSVCPDGFVYNLEVEHFHTYTANSIVVHNCHHFAADSYRAVLRQCTHCYWFLGVSGTPWRDSGDALHMLGVTGPIIYEATKAQMIAEGLLVPCYVLLVHLPEKRYSSDMTYAMRRRDYLTHNPIRMTAIAEFCQYQVSLNRSTIVLVDLLDQAETIHNVLDQFEVKHAVMVASGKFNRGPKVRQVMWEDLQDKRNLVLVTTLANEGIDVPSLDSVVIAAGGASTVKTLQRVRCQTAAPGKEYATLLDFADKSRYFGDHFAERLRMYTGDATSFRIQHITKFGGWKESPIKDQGALPPSN